MRSVAELQLLKSLPALPNADESVADPCHDISVRTSTLHTVVYRPDHRLFIRFSSYIYGKPWFKYHRAPLFFTIRCHEA